MLVLFHGGNVDLPVSNRDKTYVIRVFHRLNFLAVTDIMPEGQEVLPNPPCKCIQFLTRLCSDQVYRWVLLRPEESAKYGKNPAPRRYDFLSILPEVTPC